MILHDRSPCAMTSAERRTEIARILATGYVRLLLSRSSSENSLDDSRHPEAPCGSQAKNPETTEDTA